MTAFNHSYAERILNELEKHGRLSFNELLKRTGIPHKSVFVSTLKKLKEVAKQIENEVRINEDGKVTSEYFLTEYTKLKQQWGIHERINTNREDKFYRNSKRELNRNKKRNKTYLLLLLLYKAAFGSGYQKSTSKPGPGNHAIYERIEKKYHNFYVDIIPGVSEEDLISQGNIDMGGAFAYLDFTDAEVKECFKELKEHNPSILKPYRNVINNGQMRFGIANKSLYDFISDAYAGIFPHVRPRMENTWLYIRQPEKRSGEINWYVSLFGEKETIAFIKKMRETHNKLDKKNEEEKYKIIKSTDEIKIYDSPLFMRHHYLVKILSTTKPYLIVYYGNFFMKTRGKSRCFTIKSYCYMLFNSIMLCKFSHRFNLFLPSFQSSFFG